MSGKMNVDFVTIPWENHMQLPKKSDRPIRIRLSLNALQNSKSPKSSTLAISPTRPVPPMSLPDVQPQKQKQQHNGINGTIVGDVVVDPSGRLVANLELTRTIGDRVEKTIHPALIEVEGEIPVHDIEVQKENSCSSDQHVPRRGRGRPKGSRNKRRSGSRKPSKSLKPIREFDSSTYDERKIKQYIRDGVLPDGWRAVRHQRGVSGGARTKGSYMTYLAPDNSRFRSLVAVYRFLGKLPPSKSSSSSSSSRSGSRSNQRRRKRRKVVYNNGNLGCSKCRFSSNGCVRCRSALEEEEEDDDDNVENDDSFGLEQQRQQQQVRSSDDGDTMSFDSDTGSGSSPSSSSSETTMCPNNHNLEMIVVNKEEVHCDRCDILQMVGTHIRGCRLCDWDICESCCGEKK
jgi:hypothetical protein